MKASAILKDWNSVHEPIALAPLLNSEGTVSEATVSEATVSEAAAIDEPIVKDSEEPPLAMLEIPDELALVMAAQVGCY